MTEPTESRESRDSRESRESRESSESSKSDAHLATYGTLRPGEENHWVVRTIPGTWTEGSVRGWSYTLGFGPAEGYPGFTADADGQPVAVAVLTTPATTLAKHWRDIDDFEGPGYRRIEIDVDLDDGRRLTAWIYETDPDAE